MSDWLHRRGFLLLLGVAVLSAFAWPGPAASEAGGLAQTMADWAVALIFFQQGLSLATRQMLAGSGPLRLHLFVLGWNFALFPALSALLILPTSFLIGRELGIGFWMLAILPTTIASATALSVAAGGAAPQAIFSSIFSNLLAIVLVPVLAVAFLAQANQIEVSLVPVFTKLCGIVLLPLVLGQGLRRLFRPQCIVVSRYTAWLPQAAILYIVYLSFAQTVASGIFDTLSAACLLGALLAVILLLLVVSWAVWQSSKWMKLPGDLRISAFFTASQKSIATGLPLLTTVFAAASFPSEAGLFLVPLLLYHPLQLLLGGAVAARLAEQG